MSAEVAGASSPAVVVSCEHAANAVPDALAPRFDGAGEVLASHRGWDPGALDLALDLGRAFDSAVFAGEITRLVVDLNRSAHHRAVFSEYTRDLPKAEREALLARWHRPYVEAVAEAIAEHAASGRRVVHLASHSFTPVLEGAVRNAEIGLLYDPQRPLERAFAAGYAAAVRARRPDLRLRRNYPYRGTSDGLTVSLRKRFPDAVYAGVEIEVNQALITPDDAWRSVRAVLVEAAQEAISGLRAG